ncbi:thiamine biosynthesis protein ThiS [Thermovibrio sp.]
MGKILVEIDGKEREVEFKGKGIKVEELLELLNIFPETAVVVKEGELLCDDEVLREGNRVKVVVATSRG